MIAIQVQLRCGGKRNQCGKLLGYVHSPTDGPDGDPWILLEWRGSPVCNHGTDPLVALDRQLVDEILAKAAGARKLLPYVVEPLSASEAPTYPAWPPGEIETPTGRLRIAVIPHDGKIRRFSYDYIPPEGEVVAAEGELTEVSVDDLDGLVIHLDENGTIIGLERVTGV